MKQSSSVNGVTRARSDTISNFRLCTNDLLLAILLVITVGDAIRLNRFGRAGLNANSDKPGGGTSAGLG